MRVGGAEEDVLTDRTLILRMQNFFPMIIISRLVGCLGVGKKEYDSYIVTWAIIED